MNKPATPALILAVLSAVALLLAGAFLLPGTVGASYGSGQFCSTDKEREYNRAGYTCRPGSDGRNRLHTYHGGRAGQDSPRQPSGGNDSSCRRYRGIVRVKLSRRKHRAVRRHVRVAVRKGWPRVTRIWRPGADRRRDRALRGIPTKSGYDRDEWPMAMARRHWRAHVRYVPMSQNRSAGAITGNALSDFCNGVRFTVVFR